MKTAVIIGSTGLIGNLLVEKLAQDGTFSQVIALYRNKIPNSSGFNSPKVRALQFDFKNWDNLDVQLRSFTGTAASVFFCCLGTTMSQAGSKEAFTQVDCDYVIRFSQLARSARAEQLLVVSAIDADKKSSVFYNQVKGQMEEAVQKNFSGKLHFLRPSLLLADRQDFRFGERIAILMAPLYSHLLLGRYRRYRPVTAAKVVKAMLLIANRKISVEMFVESEQIISL